MSDLEVEASSSRIYIHFGGICLLKQLPPLWTPRQSDPPVVRGKGRLKGAKGKQKGQGESGKSQLHDIVLTIHTNISAGTRRDLSQFEIPSSTAPASASARLS